ncbi:hypothetical protein L3Y34_006839 [Caenorhabditis briggsae]|uniref:Seven TM Receptor n=1 Tax=Caenorhabditis briggsae TaxID=6238 RepID=A0AAE9A586_CAEBR|nr:hypothetical protein L3Y34_006839 [Caenorhabditis briggsae]
MPSAGNYLHWITVSHTLPLIGFITSTTLGLTVLVLNFCGAQNKFGPYKYILNSFTIFGMIFAIMEIIVYPNVHNYNAGFLVFTFTEPFGVMDLTVRRIFLASYMVFYAATIALLSTQFLYRYWGVFAVHKLRYFQGFYWLCWTAFCSFFGLQYALGTFHLFEMDTVSTEYLRDEIQYRYGWNISEIPAMALVAYDPSNGMVRWKNVEGVINIVFIVISLYGIMMFCGWSMYFKMEEKIRNFSDELKKHQKQLFKTLVLQITTPTIILFTPVFVIILMPFFDLLVSVPSGAFLCTFSLYPAMDSLIVMYVVSQYRQTTRKLYQDFKKAMESFRQARATVHHAVPTTTAHSELPQNPHGGQSNLSRHTTVVQTL